MNLDRANKIWKEASELLGGRHPDGLHHGLGILAKYVEKITTRHDDGLTFACRLRDISEMSDDDIRQLFLLGWCFDHHMEWWVFPDKGD